MRITHEIEVVAKCPSAEMGDLYRVTIVTERLIKVEEIMAIADRMAETVCFQEDLARTFADELRAKVIVEGVHFGRVATRVEAP